VPSLPPPSASTPRRGGTLHAFRLASPWTEGQVTWGNQPQTTGSGAATAAGQGYREWNVTPQLQAIYDTGANHGFLIRDAAENADGEQQLHSREKSDNRPQLVIRFAPAPTTVTGASAARSTRLRPRLIRPVGRFRNPRAARSR
jgi:hypothetical protein